MGRKGLELSGRKLCKPHKPTPLFISEGATLKNVTLGGVKEGARRACRAIHVSWLAHSGRVLFCISALSRPFGNKGITVDTYLGLRAQGWRVGVQGKLG